MVLRSSALELCRNCTCPRVDQAYIHSRTQDSDWDNLVREHVVGNCVFPSLKSKLSSCAFTV